MPAKVTHVLNNAQIAYILRSPNGPVARDLIKRGIKVQSRAKRNLGGSTGSGPRRVDSGLLRATLGTQLRSDGGDLVMRVGSGLYYSLWVHNGTGLYGPRHTWIVPKAKKFMRWTDKGGKVHFAKRVKGMKPNPYLKNALPAYKASSSA
jgi:hypothetical protein